MSARQFSVTCEEFTSCPPRIRGAFAGPAVSVAQRRWPLAKHRPVNRTNIDESGDRRVEGDAVNRFLSAIVSWLRAGYPEGMPPTDYMPVLALLARRLTTDEVKAVASELTQRGDFDHIDIGVAITQITDELPAPADIERVRERLAVKGWPLDDPRDSEDAE